jgi:hypothetical protein
VTAEEQRTLERLGADAVIRARVESLERGGTANLPSWTTARVVLDAVLPAARAQWEQEWEQVAHASPIRDRDGRPIYFNVARQRDEDVPVFVRRVEGP